MRLKAVDSRSALQFHYGGASSLVGGNVRHLLADVMTGTLAEEQKASF